MAKQKMLIIDGSSLIFRAFYALPLLSNNEGIYTNAVFGFLNMFFKIKNEIEPDYILVAFDTGTPTFRHKEYKEYKGTRKETPSELQMQFPMLIEIINLLGIPCLSLDGYEADDIAGTLAYNAEKQGISSYIITGDRDYLQLVDENTTVLLTKKGITNLDEYNIAKINDEYGLSPKQLIDLKGLVGDQSDNIPGVKGIGEKTGLKLMHEYGSIEAIYENLDEISGVKLREKLENGKMSAFLSRKLGEILLTVPVETDVSTYKVGTPDTEELKKRFDEFQFRSLQKYIDNGQSKINNKLHDYNLSENIEKFATVLKEHDMVSVKIFTDNNKYIFETPFAVSASVDGKVSYILFLDSYDELQGLKEFFEDEGIKKICHDAKEDIVLLRRIGINYRGLIGDTMVMDYLINPSRARYDMDVLVNDYLGVNEETPDELRGKGKTKLPLSEVSKEKLCRYLASTTAYSYELYSMLDKKLEENAMSKLYENLELPLVEVLASMEFLGIKVDIEILSELGKEYNNEIDVLMREIYLLAGYEFNVNSTKQLGEVLFEKLGLPPAKKTKTGYSTDSEVLESLYDKHEIIEKILRYRQLVKLNSTYIEGLMPLVGVKDKRIHSKFNQTVAQTGRISSQDPNLQNIPVKTEEGRKIRSAFVASDGSVLVDADYSQIELRVLAHISNDENMIEAFNSGIDIHTKTASEVFDVSIDEVTPVMRSRSKAVNFGIVYGISDYGLSRDLKITRKEAKEYIENYLDNFCGVKKYMKDIVEQAKDRGYVETLLNRRRYVPELQAKNFNIRSFGERVAMNTPIQGTAADIIKLAMVEVYNELKNKGLKSELILQIHDELIIESPLDEVDEVKEILKNTMESVINIKVPLVTDVKTGANWNEAK